MADKTSISVKFVGEVTGLAVATEEASKLIDKVGLSSESTQSKFDKFSKASLVAGVALGGVLVEGLKAGVENMNQLDDANVALESVLKNMPNNLGLTTEALDEQATSLESVTTFSRDQILAADQLLLKNTGVTSAIKAGIVTQAAATQTVLDYAQATGVDASTAAAKYAKILDNPFAATKALAAAGVVLTAAQTATIAAMKKSGDTAGAQAIVQQALTDKLKGTADAAGKTLPAQLQQAKEAFSNAEGELTTALIPALTVVVGWLKKVADWAQANPAAFKIIALALGGIALALVAIGVATKVWTAAQTLWNGVMAVTNAIMDASPIFIIAAVIIAIGAAFVLAYKNCATFRDIVNGAFNAIKTIAVDVYNWIHDHWVLLASIVFGPLGLVIGEVVTHFDDLQTAAQDVFKAIKKAYDDSGIGTIVSTVGKLASVGGSILGGIAGAFASGGPVGASGTYLVGENGPELVNLRGGSHVTPNNQLGGHGTVTQVMSGGRDITEFVTAVISQNTRSTRNAVTAGGGRAF